MIAELLRVPENPPMFRLLQWGRDQLIAELDL